MSNRSKKQEIEGRPIYKSYTPSRISPILETSDKIHKEREAEENSRQSNISPEVAKESGEQTKD